MQPIVNRAGWIVAGVLALLVAASLTGVVSGGPLDPPGPTASTMKTLDDVPGSWAHALLANDGPDPCHSSRFLCVLPTVATPTGAGVLDRETGLVWQRVPPNVAENWQPAVEDCISVMIGGRFGWRLPRIEEYRSLLDATGGLPAGHPFSGVLIGPSDYYWSSSTVPSDSTSTYPQTFGVAFPYVTISKGNPVGVHPWCVRGGAGIEGM